MFNMFVLYIDPPYKVAGFTKTYLHNGAMAYSLPFHPNREQEYYVTLPIDGATRLKVITGPVPKKHKIGESEVNIVQVAFSQLESIPLAPAAMAVMGQFKTMAEYDAYGLRMPQVATPSVGSKRRLESGEESAGKRSLLDEQSMDES